jgi:hypothetical protein
MLDTRAWVCLIKMPLSLSQNNVSCEWDAARISHVTREMTWVRCWKVSRRGCSDGYIGYVVDSSLFQH